ncbi:MAG: dipicolinate synthase subunit DpsA [Clostridia bacterium]|nr:dipicolinate synthase subunit DpsA [Clostridia bacterium]
MKKINSFLVIGGDSRQLYVADYLENKGYEVYIYGFDDKNRKCIDKLNCLSNITDAVVFPLPVSKDGKNINSIIPIKESFDDILAFYNNNIIIFGGMFGKGIENKMRNKNIVYFDYFNREDVTVKNTVPTVQGILKTIIDNVDYTIHSSRCAVFGYGRVGKITADVLASIGADVTVCARKNSDLANVEIKKLNGCLIKDFYKHSDDYDIIINTVPSLVIDLKIIENLKKDCLIIDVSSAPYGTDFATAYNFGINAIQCPSLPGKVAPKTAGKIIGEAIVNIMKEEDL